MKIGVIGLGAIGSQVLWQLSQTPGVQVTGFESGFIGHPFAGAGGEGRLFRNLELTTDEYMPLILRADELWNKLQADSGRTLRRLEGALLIGGERDEQLTHACRIGETWGLSHEVLDARELQKRFPQFKVADTDLGVWDTGAGVIAPERTITTAVAQALTHGVEVHEHTPVHEIADTPDGVTVTLATGQTVQFDRVVVACGGWTTKLVPELNNWIVTRRLTSLWFAGKDDNTLAGMPPFMRVAPSYCYGIPNEDGQLVKLGLGFNDHTVTGDPDSVPRALDQESAKAEIDKFRWIIQDLIPGLEPHPSRLETYIESYTRSMHEYMRIPEGKYNTVVLGGFSGHGFKLAPALGEIGADLALNNRPRYSLDFLESAEPVFSITDTRLGTTTFNPVVASAGAGRE